LGKIADRYVRLSTRSMNAARYHRAALAIRACVKHQIGAVL
jgi:hypothetical protein